ncbi:MAG: VOC family protein [Maribacter sp.]|nr:VOC family protein [Maribacter sp.]
MKIEHLAIWVNDIERMKTFYETFFGALAGTKYHNPTKNFTSYFLSFDDGPRLELMHKPDRVQKTNNRKEQIGITHFAFSVGTLARVNELTDQLRNSGYKVIGEPRTTGDGYYESVVLDPENNRVEITI